jgi:hypothetical protein
MTWRSYGANSSPLTRRLGPSSPTLLPTSRRRGNRPRDSAASRLDTFNIAARYLQHRDAIPSTSRRDTHTVAARYLQHRDAIPTPSRRDTHTVATRYPHRRDAIPTPSRRDTRTIATRYPHHRDAIPAASRPVKRRGFRGFWREVGSGRRVFRGRGCRLWGRRGRHVQ